MELYLLRHGAAANAEDDPQRGLTSQGRAQVEEVVARAAADGVRVERVYHSGILRAQQSAEIAAGALGGTVEPRSRLAPLDDVEPTVAWLHGEPATSRVLLVGHQPFLGRLMARLVSGMDPNEVVELGTAELVKLEGAPSGASGGFELRWSLQPHL
jgi:phosphohistidine phosphatase